SSAAGGTSASDGGTLASRSSAGGTSLEAESVELGGGRSSLFSTSRAVRRRITFARSRVSVVCSRAVTRWSPPASRSVTTRSATTRSVPTATVGRGTSPSASRTRCTSSSVSELCERLPRMPSFSSPATRSFGCTSHSLASSWMRFDITLPLAPLRACRQQGDERRALRRHRAHAERAYRAAAAGEGDPALRARVQVRPAPGPPQAPHVLARGGDDTRPPLGADALDLAHRLLVRGGQLLGRLEAVLIEELGGHVADVRDRGERGPRPTRLVLGLGLAAHVELPGR